MRVYHVVCDLMEGTLGPRHKEENLGGTELKDCFTEDLATKFFKCVT